VEVFSVKVDKRTKEKMRRLSHVNWSETVRQAIEMTITEQELKERRIDQADVEEACRISDSIRQSSAGWSSTEEIRRWRDRRR